ncbi:MAG: endonuclease Q family protein, partial [Desulfobulbaceae bacterium]|nr:endonuclease Q family protein [Desulfobulbaceae bacterium]
MRYIADLHIHSCFSRATSKASRLPGLAAWAAIKGIQVLGTGDFTHPGWVQHLTQYLVPAEPGFFKLATWNNDEIAAVIPEGLNPDDLPIGDIRFVLSSEISSIYKKDDKVRKIHNILYAPDFETVRRVNRTLAGIGNIESDGRPILGLDARNLLEILLEHGPDGFLVPAHIW